MLLFEVSMRNTPATILSCFSRTPLHFGDFGRLLLGWLVAGWFLKHVRCLPPPIYKHQIRSLSYDVPSTASHDQVPSTHKIEDQLLAFIEQESASYSNGLSRVAGLKKVSSRAVKDKAQELMPDVFGVAPSPDDNYGGGGDDYQAAMKRHEAKISSWCHRFLRRHRVTSLCENPLKKNKRAAGGGGGGGGGWAGYGGGRSSGGRGGGNYEEEDAGEITEDDVGGGGGGGGGGGSGRDIGDDADGPRRT